EEPVVAADGRRPVGAVEVDGEAGAKTADGGRPEPQLVAVRHDGELEDLAVAGAPTHELLRVDRVDLELPVSAAAAPVDADGHSPRLVDDHERTIGLGIGGVAPGEEDVRPIERDDLHRLEPAPQALLIRARAAADAAALAAARLAQRRPLAAGRGH